MSPTNDDAPRGHVIDLDLRNKSVEDIDRKIAEVKDDPVHQHILQAAKAQLEKEQSTQAEGLAPSAAFHLVADW